MFVSEFFVLTPLFMIVLLIFIQIDFDSTRLRLDF